MDIIEMFAEQILSDLILQGYSGNELLDRFKKAHKKVCPAVEAMLMEAKRAAVSKVEYQTYEDVFNMEENYMGRQAN